MSVAVRVGYAGPKARKNYAGTSPVTVASGCRSSVSARYVRNTRLIDALMRQAMAALAGSPGARASRMIAELDAHWPVTTDLASC